MSDHYSGHDPAGGCGMMVVLLSLAALAFWVVLIASMLDLGPFR